MDGVGGEEAAATGVGGLRSSQAVLPAEPSAARQDRQAEPGVRGAAEDRDEDKARAQMSLNFWSLGQINAPECKS